jgi:hypothetical protein
VSIPGGAGGIGGIGGNPGGIGGFSSLIFISSGSAAQAATPPYSKST